MVESGDCLRAASSLSINKEGENASFDVIEVPIHKSPRVVGDKTTTPGAPQTDPL